jgi:hypothetical protein
MITYVYATLAKGARCTSCNRELLFPELSLVSRQIGVHIRAALRREGWRVSLRRALCPRCLPPQARLKQVSSKRAASEQQVSSNCQGKDLTWIS